MIPRYDSRLDLLDS
ncbi:Protein of unknown function [Pyronema omphalodes CBS 100304]|uniref:Uncharacterized protein n=1 Tax=Pyronema omphalodes (strain CBS 100304) TaxID=1076935 RepID=U4LSU3_PYROM|nr:Protein of unknown function [Pyronema omphalodes CBS 100304]